MAQMQKTITLDTSAVDAAAYTETPSLRAGQTGKVSYPRAELDVKMKADYIFDMLLYHMYSTFGGFMLNVAGLAVIITGGMRYTFHKSSLAGAIGLMLFGVLLLVVTPLNLKLRARNTTKLPKYRNTIHYGFDGDGIDETINCHVNHYDWSQILKAVSTPKTITFYLSDGGSVLVFPKEAFDPATFQSVMWHLSHNVVMGKIFIR